MRNIKTVIENPQNSAEIRFSNTSVQNQSKTGFF